VSVPLIMALVAPLAGAVLAPAFADVPAQRRVFGAFCAAVALGGAVWAIERTVAGTGVAWRGFAVDPLRAVLVFGATLAASAALAQVDERQRPVAGQAAIFAATAAGVVPLVIAGSHLLAVALPVSTAGVAVAALASAPDAVAEFRASRALAALVASDVLALVALGSALAHGTALPPHLSTLAAALMLAAAVIRLGVAPAAGPAVDAAAGAAPVGALWLGPVRAQGILLAGFAVAGHRSVAYAAAAAATLAIVATGMAPEKRRETTLPALSIAVVLLGFALGGPAPAWGAVLALTAAFAGPVAWASGGAASAAARATLGALAGGGLVAGAVLVIGSAFDAGAVRPWFLAFAIPASAGAVAACSSVWSREARERVPGVAAAVAAAIGTAVALTIAAAPERATEWLAVPVARSLGVGTLLSTGGERGFAGGLAVIVLVVGVVGFAVGPGVVGGGGPPGRSRNRVRLFDWWAGGARAPGHGSALAAARASLGARRWTVGAMVLFVASIGLAARVYVVAAGRGFL
jgi:hypothetical protein